MTAEWSPARGQADAVGADRVGRELWAQPRLWLLLFVLWPQLSGKKVANACPALLQRQATAQSDFDDGLRVVSTQGQLAGAADRGASQERW